MSIWGRGESASGTYFIKCIPFIFLGNTTYTESTDRIKLSADENDVKNSILTIENSLLEDRQFYNCTATNTAIRLGNQGYEVAVESVYVRVKGSCRIFASGNHYIA